MLCGIPALRAASPPVFSLSFAPPEEWTEFQQQIQNGSLKRFDKIPLSKSGFNQGIAQPPLESVDGFFSIFYLFFSIFITFLPEKKNQKRLETLLLNREEELKDMAQYWAEISLHV